MILPICYLFGIIYLELRKGITKMEVYPQKFWVQNIFGSKNFFGPIILWVQKYFWVWENISDNFLVFLTPSRFFSDIFQSYFRTLQLPFRYPHSTFLTPIRHLSNTLKTPFRHLQDIPRNICRS